MKTLKKTLCLVLALVMVVGTMAISAAAFDDDADIKYTTAAKLLNDLGVIKGTDGKFNPTASLTRDQGAAFITRILGMDDLKLTTNFEDVKGLWSESAVAFCELKGIVAGYGDGKFGPADPLTVAQFEKMLILALGYNADDKGLVGNDWAANTAIMVKELNLASGASGLDPNAAITREQAAQLTYNTIVKQTYKYNAGTIIGNGTISVNVGGNYEAIGTNLLKDTFNVTRTFDRTYNGAPATVFTDNNRVNTYGWVGKQLVLPDEADFTFTTAMTQSQLYAAIGTSGLRGNNNRYFVIDNLYVDGVETDNNVSIYNTSRDAVPFMGNGVTVELFNNPTIINSAWNFDAHYDVVVTNEYFGYVSGVTAANANSGAKRYVTVNGWRNYTTEDFAKYDYVVYTVCGDSLVTVVAPESLHGTVTRYTSAGVMTVEGKEYATSKNYTGDPIAAGVTGTFYLDTNGNVLSFENDAPAAWNYGVLTEYEASVANETLLGATSINAEKAKIVGTDGKTTVYDFAFAVNSTGAVKFVTTGNYDANSANANRAGDALEGKLVRFRVDDNNKITAIQASSVAAQGDVDDSSAAETLSRGSAVFNGKYLTSSTIIILKGTDGKYSVVNGYTKLDSNKESASGTGKWQLFYVVKNGAPTDNISVLYFEVNKANNYGTSNKYAYVNSASFANEIKNGESVKTYNASIDGAEYAPVTVSANDAVAAKTVYVYNANSNGIDSLTNGVDISAGTKVTAADATYYVAGSVVYYNTDTDIYTVDANTGVVAKVSAVPASNSSADVYATVIAGNGATSDEAATVVYCYVVSK